MRPLTHDSHNNNLTRWNQGMLQSQHGPSGFFYILQVIDRRDMMVWNVIACKVHCSFVFKCFFNLNTDFCVNIWYFRVYKPSMLWMMTTRRRPLINLTKLLVKQYKLSLPFRIKILYVSCCTRTREKGIDSMQ